MLRSSSLTMAAPLRRSVAKLLAVIRMPGEAGGGAVQLLGEQHLRERMRQRERRQAQEQRGPRLCPRVQPIGAADDEGGGRLLGGPAPEVRRELRARQLAAALVE